MATRSIRDVNPALAADPSAPAATDASAYAAGASAPAAAAFPAQQSFEPGALVLVTLNAPREKFLGCIHALTAVGVSIRGIELASFTDFSARFRSGDAPHPSLVFFPMHRVERMVMDAPEGEIPSLEEQFRARTGRSLRELLTPGADAAAPQDGQ